ncbi:MAG TPA: hypothetical protein ENJ09_14270 [Planctomycetes bacterium]|nr:hypothetical protein [Planctomycetota bacterium]
MATSRVPTVLLLGLGCIATLAPGCAGPEREEGPPRPPRDLSRERPFTTRFLEPTAVVAEEVTIEGPSDLLQHVAIRQDPEAYLFTTRTTPDGLLQEVQLRPNLEEGVGGRELHAELDAWSIVAFRRIRVLQRPGDVPVIVRAIGDAAILPVDGEPQRGASLVVRGESGTP